MVVVNHHDDDHVGDDHEVVVGMMVEVDTMVVVGTMVEVHRHKVRPLVENMVTLRVEGKVTRRVDHMVALVADHMVEQVDHMVRPLVVDRTVKQQVDHNLVEVEHHHMSTLVQVLVMVVAHRLGPVLVHMLVGEQLLVLQALTQLVEVPQVLELELGLQV